MPGRSCFYIEYTPMKYFLLMFLMIYMILPGYGQSWFSYHYDLNNDAEAGLKICKSNSRFAILVGAKCNGNTTNCIELIRIDEHGELIWGVVLDTMDVVFFDNLVTTDSAIYVSGPLSGQDRFGIKLLQFNWEGQQVRQLDLSEQFPMSSVINLSQVDSSLVLTFNKRGGGQPLGNIPDTTYYYFLDYNLNYLRHYSLSSGEYRLEAGQGLQKASDGSGYYSARWASNSTWLTPNYLDLIKFDSLGNVMWTYPAEYSEVGRFPHLTLTPDGGVVLAWHKEDFETIDPIYPLPSKLLKIDTWGTLEWEYTFESIYPKELGTLFTTTDGDIVGIGLEELYDSPDTDYEVTAGWIFCMSPEGELKWERNLLDSRYLASGLGMFLIDGLELDNGDLMFTGVLQDTFPGGVPAINNPNTWVIRTDSMGCLTPDCGRVEVVTEQREIISEKIVSSIILFPNPATDKLFIEVKFPVNTEYAIKVCNSLGNTVFNSSLKNTQVELDISSHPSGLYYVFIEYNHQVRFVKKYIKL